MYDAIIDKIHILHSYIFNLFKKDSFDKTNYQSLMCPTCLNDNKIYMDTHQRKLQVAFHLNLNTFSTQGLDHIINY